MSISVCIIRRQRGGGEKNAQIIENRSLFKQANKCLLISLNFFGALLIESAQIICFISFIGQTARDLQINESFKTTSQKGCTSKRKPARVNRQEWTSKRKLATESQ